MTKALPAVTSDANGQTVTLTEGTRQIYVHLPGQTVVDGQTFLSDQGGAEASYREGNTTRGGGPNIWMSNGTIKVKWTGKGGVLTFGPGNWTAESPGNTVITSGTTQDPITNVSVVPVGPGGSILVQNPNGSSGSTSAFTGTASLQRTPTGKDVIVYTETGGNRVIYLEMAAGNGPFVPNATNQQGRITIEETISGVVHRWQGNGGTVVPTLTTFPQGQYSINAIPMSPDGVSPATGTFTLNGVIIYP
jgi:hypothetical protein